MKRNLLFFLLYLTISASVFSQNKTKNKIIDLLHRQDQAWNRGDIEAFMETYWNNDSLMFIGKSGVTYGWTNTLKNYKKGYPDTTAMGQLDFTLIQIQKISRRFYHVTGKWHLSRTVGDLQGHFTLLIKKIKGHWKIISDHSS